MKTLQVGELKANFSQIIKEVINGEEVVISYGKKKENVAVIIPYNDYKKKNKIKLGLLKGKASFKIKEDFNMTAEELLNIK